MIRKLIDVLKDRPPDERRAIAGWVAVTVVAALSIVWAIYFVKRISNITVPQSQSAAVQAIGTVEILPAQ